MALLQAVEFAQMNVSQMHERLRLELLRRIQCGRLSVTLLARQTGFGPSHVSSFLHGHRNLSLAGMDRVLSAQHMAAADLLPAADGRTRAWREKDEIAEVPLVSHASAMFEPLIRPGAILGMVRWQPSGLESIRASPSNPHRKWERFVAIQTRAQDANPMEPLILPEATVILDRHFVSLTPYRPNRPNVYAVRDRGVLKLRYVDLQLDRLVLRPHNLAFPVDLVELEPGQSPGDFLAGRVVHIRDEP